MSATRTGSNRSGLANRILGAGLLGAETSREGDRATTLELFFDLVYAFAFTQVTALMVHHETIGGVLQGLVILLLLWGPWASFAWLANQAHADRGIVRIGMIAATLIMFFASLAVPAAYRAADGPVLGTLLFAIAFFLVQLVHMVVYLVAARSDTALRRQIIVTESSALLPAAALLVIGGLVGAPFQVWIWLVAVAFQWVMIYVTSNGGNWRINSLAHFAERHGLVVLLALGESVIAIGSGVARLPLGGSVLLGSGFGIGIGIALWWAYFHHLAPKTEQAVGRRSGVERTGIATEVYTYLHFPLIAGIVIAALGVETALGHVPGWAAPGHFSAFALGGGVALYLAGTAFVWLRVSGEWSVLRFAAAVLLLALIPVLAIVPALVSLGVVLLIVVGLEVAEGLLGQRGKVRGKKPLSATMSE
ncbi:MAG TPA: low temperature requirement protein A [Pseudolysinimonas sp.]